MGRSVPVALVISFAFACGGTSPPAETAPAAEPPAPAPEPESATAEPVARSDGDGRIRRTELEPILDAGLGRFLQGVETEPALESGRFVGFRVLSLYPNDERVSGAGIAPGDVIVRVNGQPIERPEQALRVWNGLRVASHLWIEYRRGDEERELRFEIVEDGQGSAQPSAVQPGGVRAGGAGAGP